MPATILSTAGFDILRDAGRAYARRLESEGVSVLYLNFPSLNHSFLQASGVIADADSAATDTARIFGDRKSVVLGKSVSVRVDLGGCSLIKKKHSIYFLYLHFFFFLFFF